MFAFARGLFVIIELNMYAMVFMQSFHKKYFLITSFFNLIYRKIKSIYHHSL